MTTFLLIPHGENDYVATGRLAGRLPGVRLNPTGLQQAEAVARSLADAPITAIYASPLERCRETAAPLAAALGLAVTPEDGLLEVDFGDWQDQTLKELRGRKLWQAVQANPSRVRFPGGETFAAAQQRITQSLENLAARHAPTGLVACFSHSDLIKLALGFYLGQPLDLFQRIHIAPASISVLHLGEMGAQVICTNHQASGFTLPPPAKAE